MHHEQQLYFTYRKLKRFNKPQPEAYIVGFGVRFCTETGDLIMQKVITQIVWNGCDGYDVSNLDVFKGSQHFTAFFVEKTDAPIVDGEPCFDGLFVANDGNTYKAI